MINSDYLKNLNNAQKEAVLYLNGPLLIVAGAGSGKTKVLTSRIAHIIKEKKAFPNQILSVTFTNKAAKEMQTRVSRMLGSAATGLSWLGTFHSICAKLLRKHASAVNLNSNFTIIDTDDQTRLIKNICKAENIDVKKISPKFVLSFINQWKNKGLLPENVTSNKGIPLEKAILNVYKFYQERLKILNTCDFGDLILLCVVLFENNQDILNLYSKNLIESQDEIAEMKRKFKIMNHQVEQLHVLLFQDGDIAKDAVYYKFIRIFLNQKMVSFVKFIQQPHYCLQE